MVAARLDFTGTAAKLLDKINWGQTDTRPAAGWPKTARAASAILKRNAPALRQAGWVVQDAENLHTKVTEWRLIHPEIARNQDPQHPQHPQSAGFAGVAGNQYGQSEDDGTLFPGVCQVCGYALHRSLVEAGETTHPNC
jgi:hypothetical protein